MSLDTSFALTRDQEIMYSGKDKWMLIENRFTLFSAWTLREIPGMPCHIILTKTKKKERKKQTNKQTNKEGNPSKVIEVANWSVYFKGLIFFAAGFRRDFD